MPLQYGHGGGGGGGFNAFDLLSQLQRGVPSVFEENYRAYSMAMAGRADLEKGDKSACGVPARARASVAPSIVARRGIALATRVLTRRFLPVATCERGSSGCCVSGIGYHRRVSDKVTPRRSAGCGGFRRYAVGVVLTRANSKRGFVNDASRVEASLEI